MEIIRGYKIKYLDQVLKRKLTKFWYLWRFFDCGYKKFTITARPFKSAARSPNTKSPIMPKKQTKIIHRNTHSCLEDLTKVDSIKSTPIIQGLKLSENLFDQIRLSLQNKAGTVDCKNASSKAETGKIKSSKKKLFHAEKPSANHKRTMTVPESNLAVVSSKTEKQLIFKPTSKKIF